MSLHARTGGLLASRAARAELPEFAEDGLPEEFPEAFCGRAVVSAAEVRAALFFSEADRSCGALLV